MIPVLTPQAMSEVDRRAPEPIETLVDRAATKVALAAIDLMGGGYGRRVVVVAGPGNNGADGRVAAMKLRRRGVAVALFDASDLPVALPPADLVIDAAFGTGFRGEFSFPDHGGSPVLAVDIPSGVSGLTGEAGGDPAAATATVTFAALKPGLLFGAGRDLAGSVRLVDIGLDVSGTAAHLVEDLDVARWIPRRATDSHKWHHAVWVFAGSPGMSGAARLCCSAAFRAGAGYVRHTSTTRDQTSGTDTIETVFHPLDVSEWSAALSSDSQRFASVVLGPGLGRSGEVEAAVRQVASMDGFALVLDGDALSALGQDVADIVNQRTSPTVLTPHDGEFERLTGSAPGADRIDSARQLATRCGCVVLLKGSTTVVAAADGSVLLSNTGDSRLATAGTGDVLSGIVAAHLAASIEPARAAASAAFVHGLAGSTLPPRGLIASDLVAELPATYSGLLA